MVVPTNESKEKIKKYEDLWIKIRRFDYDEKYAEIKFNSDDELPLNKMVDIPTIKIFVRAIFLENNKYYLQVFLDKSLYKI